MSVNNDTIDNMSQEDYNEYLHEQYDAGEQRDQDLNPPDSDEGLQAIL